VLELDYASVVAIHSFIQKLKVSHCFGVHFGTTPHDLLQQLDTISVHLAYQVSTMPDGIHHLHAISHGFESQTMSIVVAVGASDLIHS